MSVHCCFAGNVRSSEFSIKGVLVLDIFSVRLGGECKKSYFMHEVGGGMIGRAGNGVIETL